MRVRRSGGIGLTAGLLLAALCLGCSHGPKVRKSQGVYYPDVAEFFQDPAPFKSKDVALAGLGLAGTPRDKVLTLRQSGFETLLFVADIRHLAGTGDLRAGDRVDVVIYCGDGSLASGNILKAISRSRR